MQLAGVNAPHTMETKAECGQHTLTGQKHLCYTVGWQQVIIKHVIHASCRTWSTTQDRNNADNIWGNSTCTDMDTDMAASKNWESRNKQYMIPCAQTWIQQRIKKCSFCLDHVAIYAVPYGLTDVRVPHLRHFFSLFSPSFLAGGKARLIQPRLRSAESWYIKQRSS